MPQRLRIELDGDWVLSVVAFLDTDPIEVWIHFRNIEGQRWVFHLLLQGDRTAIADGGTEEIPYVNYASRREEA